MLRTVAITILSLTLASATVYADGFDNASPADAPPAVAVVIPPVAAGLVLPPAPFTRGPVVARAKRPSMLPALYVSLAGLQAFDGYSTTRTLAHGGYEANGLMGAAAGNSAALWGFKIASTAVPIVLAERMWRTNRVAAIAMMVAVNAIGAAVAANNAHVLLQLH